MAQYFELSLKAKWNKNAQGKESQEAELGGKFGEKIAKTLGIFNKIKKTTQDISNSPLAKGKVMFEIKSPIIAVSAQWYLVVPQLVYITLIVNRIELQKLV